MVDLPDEFVRAVREGRYRDAATDKELQSRSAGGNDPVARALLILAAAHHIASSGNIEGARLTVGRAVHFLEQAPLDPFAMLLIEHAHQALSAMDDARDLPPFPLAFR